MEDSEELALGFKTWKRCVDPIEKDGFREGFEEGRNESFQLGFNIGFENGSKRGFSEGFICGKAKSNNELYKDKLENIGKHCVMCSESEEKITNTPLEEIIEINKIN